MLQKKSKALQHCGKSDIVYSPEEIRKQLQKIIESPDFDATRQQRAFLNFIVSQTLSGNTHGIKGYTVATQVFGRGENFDQAIDPIVSIQANKLRRSLERYYLLSGKEDALYIEIPKGTYVPVFRRQESVALDTASKRGNDQDTCFEGSWPTVLIKPFLNLTNSPKKNYWGTGFATELAAEINRFQWISVLQYDPENQGRRCSDLGARFVIEGSIREDKDGIKVVVNLMDSRDSRQIWSDTQHLAGGVSGIITLQERVANIVGTKIAGEQGIISRTLSVESKNKRPDQLNTYEAILRYHEYDQTHSPEDFFIAFEVLENARCKEPECGQVWSLLARIYANIYSLEIPGFDLEDAENKALAYAEMGTQLNPDSQGARGILALIRLFSDDLAAARRDINFAYELHPNSLFLMDGIGYLKTLLGDWEHGPALIRRVIRLNPYYKTVVHYALWVDYLRQQDFKNAYLETSQLRRPAIFWYPLAKASTLGLLNRIEEGRKFAGDLIALKPDFQERGRVLIRRYIKFDDIVDRLIEGLSAVGVELSKPDG
ncbi:MAG: hypothetical protein OEM01_14040 [Desulfobulbaceae bacterium]|nr:hypothetical protein [Desulfobulbaceae bacterium]